jgi:hypothetical protein
MPLKPRKPATPAKKRVPWDDPAFTIIGKHLQREKEAREAASQPKKRKRKP